MVMLAEQQMAVKDVLGRAVSFSIRMRRGRLIAKVNCGPHICAEDRRGNSAALEEGPIRSLVCQFVEEVGEAILTTGVVFFERRGFRCEEMARWGRCSGCTGSATT